MTCDEARDTFSDLYDGILSGPPLVALSRHLDECRACQEEWKAFRQAMQAVSGLGVDEPPPDFASRVMGRIERPSWWRRAAQLLVFPLPVKLPLHAAALALLVLGGWWMVRETPEIEQAARVQTPAPTPKTAPSPPPAPAPAPAVFPPSVPGKVGVSPRLKGEAPPPPAAPAPPVTAPSPPAAKADTAPETKGELAAKPSPLPAVPMPAPAAEAKRGVPPPPAAPPAPRGATESVPLPKLATAPPPKSEVPATMPAGPPAPAPMPEPERRLAAPRPSAAPQVGGVTAQKERSEREALLSEERAGARDFADKAAPQEALRRAAAPPASPPPPAARMAPRQMFPAPGQGASLSADERFSGAANAFAAREYVGATEGFRTFLTEHPNDPRIAEARFYLAESLFAQERYGEAASLYAEFLKESPDHRLAVTALYRQGLSRLAAGDSSGCALLKSALDRAPRARDAAAAKEALARCQ